MMFNEPTAVLWKKKQEIFNIEM